MKILVLLTLCCFISSQDIYKNSGLDWTGQCSIGTFQSPINIVHGLNTENTGN
jgi:hypothetical protein